MAKSFFDLMQAQQPQSGYAPFSPQYIEPQPAMREPMQRPQRQDYSSQPRQGGVTPNFAPRAGIPNMINQLVKKFAYRKPEAKLGRSLNAAINSALDEKTAQKMQSGMDARSAVVAAAEELYASTAGSKQSPEFRDQIRAAAMGRLSQMGEFDPEAKSKFAAANAPPDLGDVENYQLPGGRVLSLPKHIAQQVLADNPEAMKRVDIEGTGTPIPGDTKTAFEGDQRFTFMYDPNGDISARTPNAEGWVKFSGDARAAAGGDAADPRTDSQQGAALADAQNNLVGLETANEAMNTIIGIADKADASGIPGTTGTVGAVYRGLGEATAVVKAAANFSASQFGAGAKVYDGGKQTYSELTDPSKYDKQFSNFAEGANLSARSKAALINLAYLLAISQEASARAISDKDIAFRLQTIGANISDGKTLRDIIQDRRVEAFNHLRSKLSNDFRLSDRTNPDADFVWRRLEDLQTKYLNGGTPATSGEEVPDDAEFETVIGAKGPVVRRKK